MTNHEYSIKNVPRNFQSLSNLIHFSGRSNLFLPLYSRPLLHQIINHPTYLPLRFVHEGGAVGERGEKLGGEILLVPGHCHQLLHTILGRVLNLGRLKKRNRIERRFWKRMLKVE